MSDSNDLSRLFESLGTSKDRRRGKGAAIGAGVGATIGSIIGGPIGAAIGGALGAGLGVGVTDKSCSEDKEE